MTEPSTFATALANETFQVFRNLGRGHFSDATYPSHVGTISMPVSGWSEL